VENEDYYFVQFNDMTSSALGIDTADITNTAGAQAAIGVIDSAIQSKDTERTRIGAFVERLQGTIQQLQIARENATTSESQIRDADIATEMSNFVKSQILMQTGVSMLAQANMLPQIIAGIVR
jgi:flagellin